MNRSELKIPIITFLQHWRAGLMGLLLAGYGAVYAEGPGLDHQALYLEALERAESGELRIAAEMGRISNGSVAHYDFLQFQHIELLRNARALLHPPAQLAPVHRQEIVDRAGELVAAAESLELVIADFLRGQAVLGSALSNTRDIARQWSASLTDPYQSEALQQLIAAAFTMSQSNSPASQEALDKAFSLVLARSGEGVARTELALQRQMIRDYQALPAAAMERLRRSGVKVKAVRLGESYLAAAGAE